MKTENCADVVALLRGRLVLVSRLTTPMGLALPGGRQNPGETIEECAVREFHEETGLSLKIMGTLGRYDDPGRDPRGPKVTTVFYGEATGTPRNEPGKTCVQTIDPSAIGQYKDSFVFDHYKILHDWYSRCICIVEVER